MVVDRAPISLSNNLLDLIHTVSESLESYVRDVKRLLELQ